jgi:AraC-like DNA-binding protein
MRRQRVILVLHTNSAVYDAVASAAAEGTLVSAVADWQSLEDAIRAAPPSTVAVIDPYHGGTPPGPAAELHTLLQRLPSASVVPALSITPERAGDVATLDSWGVAALISMGHDDTPAAIGHRLADACVRPLKRRVAGFLPPESSPHAYVLLFAALDTICDNGNVADFAATVDASPSTLLRWCDEAGLPNPRTLLQWVRVLLAMDLLDDPTRTLDAVAGTAGYASPAELRKVTLRLLGTTPSQLRTSPPIAFQLASERFLAAVTTASD